ncbi:MAG: DUF882 domain-containing protein [Synergistes sp.]|nr:DUF882 domain-containing protein [Synergistes sp.]
MRLNDFKISENFNLREFQCPCCHTVMLHGRLLAALQRLRKTLSRPVIITSGYRCAAHNKAVGGVKNSLHMKGLAADIAADGAVMDHLRELAHDAGFSRVITYPARSFAHLEISDD